MGGDISAPGEGGARGVASAGDSGERCYCWAIAATGSGDVRDVAPGQ